MTHFQQSTVHCQTNFGVKYHGNDETWAPQYKRCHANQFHGVLCWCCAWRRHLSLSLGHCIILFLCIQKVHSFPCTWKKKAPQIETVAPSSPPHLQNPLFACGQVLPFFWVTPPPKKKRCRFSNMSLKQLALFGYSKSAQFYCAHEKKKRHELKQWRKAPPPPTPPKLPISLWAGFAIFLGDPAEKRCHFFPKMSLKSLALFGYSKTAEFSRAHEKKKRHELKQWRQVTHPTLPNTLV